MARQAWTDWKTIFAVMVAWIGQQREDQPFFLYWSWTSPHTPVVPIEAFQGSTEAGPYGDFMHQSDAHLGEVLQALEDHGFAENTLVIFSSDNGPESIAYALGQERNLIAEHPEKAAALRAKLEDIRKRGYSAPRLMDRVTPESGSPWPCGQR